MQIRKLALAFVFSSGMFGVATAADLAPAPEPLPTAFIWAGPYIGVQGGYAFGEAEHSFSNDAPSGDSEPKGWIGGGHLGFLFPAGTYVIGIEGDFEASDIDESFEDLTGITSSGGVDVNWLASARGRFGFPMGRVLPYVTGGLAFADVDLSGGPGGAPDSPCCGYSDTMVGWTVGGGVDFAVTDNISARVEYRYTDLGKADGNLRPFNSDVKMPVELTLHAIRGGVSFHF